MTLSQSIKNDINELPKWFVLNAYKAEKKAEDELKNNPKFQTFIAKKYTIRTYHGRRTRELVPIIANIIFVKGKYQDIDNFQSQRSYINFATYSIDGHRKIMTVPDNQMQNFINIARHFEEEITFYRPEEINIKKGCKVKVHGGIFDGLEGTLMKVKGKRSKRIVVLIENVVAVAATEIQPDLIEILK